MRAVIGDTLGPPDHFHIVETCAVAPAPGEVRLRVAAASLGYADALVASGGYQVKPELPFTPGTEAAGWIDAIGPGVTGWSVGDRVTGSAFGGALADYFVVSAASVKRVPDGLNFAQAAGFRVNFTTALYALADRGQLAAGETLLVLGAAGGVGIASVQIGHALGARVIAAASTAEKRAFARAHGADTVIDYTRADWREALRAETGGRGVDVVLDPVGGATFEPAFRSLAWGGRHLVVGFTGGPIPRLPANLALLKGAALVGVEIRQFAAREPQAYAATGVRLDRLVAAGTFRPPIGPRYKIEDFRAALAMAGSGKALGKVIVEIGPA